MTDFESYTNEIVGPLRASRRRKTQIREELLSHLDEAARSTSKTDSGDECSAQVIERFGDSGEVRARIQSTVPRVERALHRRLLIRKSGERDFTYACRVSAWNSFTISIAFAVLNTVAEFAYRSGLAWFKTLAESGAMFAFVFPVFVVLLTAVLRYNRLFREGKSRAAITLVTLFSFGVCVLTFCVFMSLTVVIPQFRPYLPFAGAICGAGAGILACATVAEARWKLRHVPWEKLGENL